MNRLEIKIIPEHFAYTAEYDVDNYMSFFDEETGENILQDLEDLMHEENPDVIVPEIPDDYNYITHATGQIPSPPMHVKYYDMVDRMGKDNADGAYRFVKVPEVKAATMLYKGPFETIPDGFAQLFALIEKENYTVCGESRASAIHGPWDRDNKEDYVMELQVPIE